MLKNKGILVGLTVAKIGKTVLANFGGGKHVLSIPSKYVSKESLKRLRNEDLEEAKRLFGFRTDTMDIYTIVSDVKRKAFFNFRPEKTTRVWSSV